MEAGMRWPAGILDVGFVPVGNETTGGEEEVVRHDEGAAEG